LRQEIFAWKRIFPDGTMIHREGMVIILLKNPVIWLIDGCAALEIRHSSTLL
jgi:hypothetical protein